MSKIRSPVQETRESGDEEASMITLRPIHLSDVDDFLKLALDDRVTKFCTREPFTSKDQALDFFTTNVIPHPWLRAICLGNRTVGLISVSLNSGNSRCRGELGYVLAYEHWGKGIATQAVNMVVSVIFHELDFVERLEAFVDVDNVGSQRVLEKAGFVREGVLKKYVIVKGICRDMVLFSLLSSRQD